MVDLQRDPVNVALCLMLILYLQITLLEAKKPKQECPIGFQLGLTKTRDKICYSLKKDPEPFTSKFNDCTGNLFTIPNYNSLGIPKSENLTIWTDYKSLYPGGPFIDWSYAESTGHILYTSYEVHRDPYLSVDEELCVVIHPVYNFTAVRCDEMHYRYCFVEAYPSKTSEDGCEDLTDGIRFWSPIETNLCERRKVRATWNQSQTMCKEKGGSILGRGWRYSNYFMSAGALDLDLPMYPLNFMFNSDHTLLKYGGENDSSYIPSKEWHFGGIITNNTRLGAINNNDFWDLVNSSYIFYNVICERPIQLGHVNLTVSIGSGDELITLTVNDTLLDEDSILCFTDSFSYYPQRVTVRSGSEENIYILKALDDGYYWCTHNDLKNFYISESNKALFVKVKESTENMYAVKLRTFDVYKMDKIVKLLHNVWKLKIQDYVFYSTKYFQKYEGSASYDNYTIMDFKNSSPGLPETPKDKKIIQKLKLKRIYLDARTVLIHVGLHPDMKPVKPGQWENIVVEYMKPVYYCDKDKKLSLDMTYSTPDCEVYTCVGNYNDGVQTVITPQDKCNLSVPVTLTTAVNVSDVTPVMLTTTPTAMTARPNIVQTTKEVLDRSGSDSSEECNKTTITVIETTTVTDTSYEVSTVSNEVLTVTTPPQLCPPCTTQRPTSTEPTTTEMTSPTTTETSLPTTTETTPPTTTETTPPTTTEMPPPTTTETTLPPTRPPPDQQLEHVIRDLEFLLYNNTDPVGVQDIGNAFYEVNQILFLDEVEIPGNLLHLLDEIGARIDLNGSFDSYTVKENIALLVADAQPSQPVKGFRLASRNVDTFTNNTFEIIRDNINSTQLETTESEVVVSLPDSVSASSRRVSFVVFRNDRAFRSGHEMYFVNSRVLSVKVENVTEFHDGEVIDIHLKPITSEPERNQSRTCAFWQFNKDDSGNWSQEGCTFIRATAEGLLDTCRCDHLTHFAEILVPRTVFSEKNEAALEMLSIIGCSLSIFGLTLVGLTAVLFRSWRRDYSNKVWLQLCISIFLLSICFLIIVFAQFEESDIACLLIGVALHYSVLASFCWMLVAAILSYRRLVLVFTRDASHKLLRASAFAWGAPCAIVGILLSVAPHSYAGRYEDKSPSGAFCYPSGLALWLSVYAPIAIMLLANWTLFVLIVRSVFGTRRPQNHGHGANEAFRCASVSCLLVFLFGLPWIFGLFSFNVVSAYFFTILATFQGFVLFLFFVLGNKKTRDLWLNKLKIKQTRKVPVTSSTYTNRSAGANVPPRGNQTPASIEANASKPRSLSSSDNLRFS